MSYFPEPYIHSKNKVKVELDLSKYATKSDLKSATGVNASKFAKKVDLAGLKLETTPIDLSKLSNAVNDDVVKKTLYDALVKKS